MAIETLYTAQAFSEGGRDGHVRSSDGHIDLDVRAPREMGGQGGATNPEQMFAAGYAACFESAMMYIARQEKLPVTTTRVDAAVGIGPLGGGRPGFGLSVKLDVAIGGMDQAAAEDLVERAHAVCPYSNAVKGNVDVALTTRAV